MADVNGDGNLDAIGYGNIGGNVGISLGNGDGSFSDRILLDGIAGNSVTSISVGDFNGDGRSDIAVTIGSSGILGIYNGNGNGYFQSGTAIAAGTITSNSLINAADLNHDGIDDIVVNNDSSGYISTLIGKTTGITRDQEFRLTTSSSTALKIGDFNGDGKIDLIVAYQDASNDLFIALGNGDGTFTSARSMTADIEYDQITVGDVNNDGISDIVTTDYASGSLKIFLGNGDGSFSLSSTASLGAGQNIRAATLADIDGDGSHELIVGRNAAGAFIVNQVDEYSTRLEQLNLNTQELALSSLGYLEAAQRRIEQELSNIGNHMSRLSVATSNLLTAKNEFSAALSRIIDVDVAQESASLVAKKIAQDVGASILSQANQQPALALRLLQN
jgi:flagellin-like hook-associated protein FlgL